MNNKQRKTLQDIFTRPTLATVVFTDIENLLLALGCVLTEGAGSRIRFARNGRAFLCHRPHPGKEAKRYQVELVREFLEGQGITP